MCVTVLAEENMCGAQIHRQELEASRDGSRFLHQSVHEPFSPQYQDLHFLPALIDSSLVSGYLEEDFSFISHALKSAEEALLEVLF